MVLVDPPGFGWSGHKVVTVDTSEGGSVMTRFQLECRSATEGLLKEHGIDVEFSFFYAPEDPLLGQSASDECVTAKFSIKGHVFDLDIFPYDVGYTLDGKWNLWEEAGYENWRELLADFMSDFKATINRLT